MIKFYQFFGGKRFIFIIILRILESLFNLITLSLVFPLTSLFLDKENFRTKLVTYLSFLNGKTLTYQISILILILFLYAILRYFFGKFSMSKIYKYLSEQRFLWLNELTFFYLNIDFTSVNSEKSGKLVSTWFNETYNASVFLTLLISAINDLTFIAAFIIIILFKNFYFGIISLFTIILISLLLYKLKKKTLYTQSNEKVKFTQSLMSLLTEIIIHIKDIKLYNLNKIVYDQVSLKSDKLKHVLINNSESSKKPALFSEILIILIVITFLFFIGFNLISLNSTSIPLLATLFAIGVKTLGFSSQLIISFHKLSIEYQSLYLVSEKFLFAKKNKKNYLITSCKEVPKFSNLYIENLSFAYNSNTTIFKNLNLIIPLGCHVLITGKSGEGKSTLLDLITGIIRPAKGEIYFKDLSGIQHSNNIYYYSYVSQMVGLFGDEIQNCICGDKPFNKTKFEKVINICQLNQVKNIYDTPFNYKNFSGGEKNRIALARALYFEKPILIIDESLSSLEEKLEDQIINDIKLHFPFITIFQVLHERNQNLLADYKIEISNSICKIMKY
jgi:ABC-type multidrug transport system fused ATPase/permease subunit